MAEEINKEGTTTGNGYLTKPYLVRNLQTFWGKIKQYITNQISGFVKEEYVSEAINTAVAGKANQTDLDSLTTTVSGKADSSALTTLEEDLTKKLADKVDIEPGKDLSENDFTDVLKTKLENLPDSAATSSEMGFMSSDDKQNLDRLVENEIVIETLKDPSDLINNGLSCEGNSDGDIILTLYNSTKHFKIHTESGEVIEKFYVPSKNTDDQEVNFNSFGGDNRSITIPNPDENGVFKENETYKFYVESFELLGTGKYEPFILRVDRDGEDPEELTANVFNN